MEAFVVFLVARVVLAFATRPLHADAFLLSALDIAILAFVWFRFRFPSVLSFETVTPAIALAALGVAVAVAADLLHYWHFVEPRPLAKDPQTMVTAYALLGGLDFALGTVALVLGAAVASIR
ncbi:MAG: hypothetical protein AAF809_05800 [Bacteroidota bacterium]